MDIKAILTGIAVGDAFGAGVEFQDREWIREHVDFSEFVQARDRIKVAEDKKSLFVRDYKAWDYTDDTEMTIGVINALMSDEVFSEDLLIRAWKEEYEKGIAEKGYGRNGHGSMSWFYSGEKTMEEIREFQRNRMNPGNAPAMRSVPIGLIDKRLINEYAAINAHATHPNMLAVISGQCIAWATYYMVVHKGDPRNLIKYCLNSIKLNKEYETYLKRVDELRPYDEIDDPDLEILCGSQPIEDPYFLAGIKGVPSDSKYTAGSVLFVLKNSHDAMDALKKSIYLGGDVDSVASVATGIMAGRKGLKSIPEFMLANLEGKKYIEETALKFEASLSNKSKRIFHGTDTD